MANPHDHPTALKDLQDSIYRERVLRARQMTPGERLEAAFELTNGVMERMADGVMFQLGIEDRAQAWIEVRKRMDRLMRARDHGVYVSAK